MKLSLDDIPSMEHFAGCPSGKIFKSENQEPASPWLASILSERRAYFLRYLQHRLGDRDDAEDVLQDFYMRVLKKAGQIRDPASVMAWLRVVLKSVLTDYCRRRTAERQSRQRMVADWMAIFPQQEMAAPDEDDTERATCTCFHKLLPTLKPEYEEALSRVDLGQESRSDVAHALGITTGNMRVRLHRARQALKEALEHSCQQCIEHDCFGEKVCLDQSGGRKESHLVS